MRSLILFVLLIAAVAIWPDPVPADTAFQAVEERFPLQFRYPNGQFRRAADNTILAFNRAWSDTTGQGVENDLYTEFVDEDGDTVGVFIWTDLPVGKYFFVETTGTDSLFSVPDYYRIGFDMAPPASVDSDAILPGNLITSHLADSIIADPKYIESGVIRDIHIQIVDGTKIAFQSIPEDAIAPGAITAGKLSSGAKFFASGDSLEPEVVMTSRIVKATGGSYVELVGPMEWLGDHDAKSGATLDFLSGSTLTSQPGATIDLNSDMDLGSSASSQIVVKGDLTTEDDIVFGQSRGDTLGIYGVQTYYAPRILGPEVAVIDSFDTGGDVEKWTIVGGVSELQSDGYFVVCEAFPVLTLYQVDNEISGVPYKTQWYAVPKRNDPSSPTDSVKVRIPSSVSGAKMAYCVECKGIK